jgi:adenylylsulfate kinase-like enzyme
VVSEQSARTSLSFDGSKIRFETQGNDPKSFPAQTREKVNPRVVSECYAKLLNLCPHRYHRARGADAKPARARALAAHKDFFTLWKDADPDIQFLKDPKGEYAKLQ